jgi:ATP-dependent exoDNAse (exonuclease V) beta subunit
VQTLSASKIKLYLECRKRYKDKYIDKVAEIENTSSLMGKAIHTAIEAHYKGLNAAKIYHEYMIARYDEMLMADAEFKEYQSFSALLKTGRDIISTFPWSIYTPLAQELDFTIPLDDICYLHGFIDMVTDDGIVDFKSSSRKPKNLDYDIQFIIYAYAYEHLYNKPATKVYWHHLRTHEQLVWNVADMDIKVRDLQDICRIIAADTFDDIPEPCRVCKPWCHYKGEK